MGSIAYYAAPINDAERIAALLLAAHAGGARVFSSPARLAAPRALLGVEAEIAFRLGTDLQPEEALALIDLCSTRLADWPNAPARWKPADFQSNDACIAGRGTRA